MPDLPTPYRSSDDDNARWHGFPFRDGDIVISTRSKSGTTWMQMICALLVFRSAELPAPLAEVSPWLDWLVEPLDDVLVRLDAQQHRRFIKTHTPLDGLPLDARATFVVVVRHPLDMAVSLYHQGDNLDSARIRELTGQVAEVGDPCPRLSLQDWLHNWITWDGSPQESLDSLPGVMWHLSDAWRRRRQGNVILVHYADLSAHLVGEMGRIADLLGFDIDETLIEVLAPAAAFDAMKARSSALVPDRGGVLKDQSTFFRRGSSGAGSEALGEVDLAAYERRAAALAPADFLEWLHR
ncbi:MAG: sulfotransferase domain-containing protein [bacterium]|nr:sulfotransferase domain-containing protein [bacterium]